MCDQLQASAVYADGLCSTPNLDRLRERGVSFARAYTPNAVCSPARASLMTGKLPHNHNVLWVTHTMSPDQVRIKEGLPHFAQDLTRAGYQTSYVGKWHVEPAERPSWYGWQRDRSSHSATMASRPSRAHGELIPRIDVEGDGYRPALLAGVTSVSAVDRTMGQVVGVAREELRELSRSAQPWCLFVSVPEPHDPYVVGLEAFDAYADWTFEPPANWADDLEGRPRIYQRAARAFADLSDEQRTLAAKCYYASITEIDAQFGLLLDDLEGRGLDENTVVVLTTDHGDFLGAHGMYCKNLGAWEEAYKVPLVVAGPTLSRPASVGPKDAAPKDAGAGGTMSNARVGTHALFASILKHYEIPCSIQCDAPLFDDVLAASASDSDALAAADARHTDGFAEYHGGRLLLTQRVVYHDDWKLVWNGFDDHEFYNLVEDPYELRNLAGADGPALSGIGPLAKAYRDVTERLWSEVKRTGDATLANSQYVGLRAGEIGPEVTR